MSTSPTLPPVNKKKKKPSAADKEAKRALGFKAPAARKPSAAYGAAGFSTPGRLEDCYKPSTILGQGAFGKVSLAHHLLTGHPVAVKSYTSAVFSNPALATALKNEVRVLRRLSHPHVIRLFETIKQRHHMHVVTEFAPGQTVRALLRRRGKGRHTAARALQMTQPGLSEGEARAIFAQLAAAVAHVHANGIVHRDIKLDNIVLVPNAEVDAKVQLPGASGAALAFRKVAAPTSVTDGEHCRVKLIDFGLAGMAPPGTAPFTDFCGTIPYMAPELWGAADARNRTKVGAKARKAVAAAAAGADSGSKIGYGQPVDIWAMGVTLYCMLTGDFPFWAGSEDKLRKTLDKGRYAPLPTDLSPELHSIVTGMLTPDPSRRLDANGVKRHPWLAGASSGAVGCPADGVSGLAQTIGWGDIMATEGECGELDSTLVRARGTKRDEAQACDPEVLHALQGRSCTLDMAKVVAAVKADERNHFSACYLLEQRVQRAIARITAPAPVLTPVPLVAAPTRPPRTVLRDSNGREQGARRPSVPLCNRGETTAAPGVNAGANDKTVLIS